MSLRWRAADWVANSSASLPVARGLSAFIRHFPRFRPATSFAHHLGDAWSDGPVWGHLPTGSRILLNLRDHHHRHLYFYGVIEPATTALIHRSLHKGDCFIDVGANVGYYTLLAHDLDAVVVALEPNPEVFDLLERSVARTSRQPTIHLVEAGGGASTDRQRLHVSGDPGNSGLSSFHPGHSTDGSVEVTLTPVDATCDETGVDPDVVKIDTEGFELEVLRGMRRTLVRRRPRLIICEAARDGHVDPEVLIDFMAGFGYVCRRISPDGSLSVLHAVGDLENIAFIPDGEAV